MREMIACLIIGDSTGVGTAAALAAQDIRCEVRAQVGVSSAPALARQAGATAASHVLVAVGSNDPTNPSLRSNLLRLRRQLAKPRVTWLAPYSPIAAEAVRSVSVTYGDAVIPLAGFASRDRIHPTNYAPVAHAIGWQSPQARQVPTVAAAKRAKVPQRRAVVLSF
jgi:hypothetical protein